MTNLLLRYLRRECMWLPTGTPCMHLESAEASTLWLLQLSINGAPQDPIK